MSISIIDFLITILLIPAAVFFAKYIDTNNMNYLWLFLGNLFFVILCFLTKLIFSKITAYKKEIELLNSEVVTLKNNNELLTSNNTGLKQNLEEKEKQLVKYEVDANNLYTNNVKLSKYISILLEHTPPEERKEVTQIIELERLIDGGSDHGRI